MFIKGNGPSRIVNAAGRAYGSPQDGEASGSNGRIKWGHGVQTVPSDRPSTTTCLVLRNMLHGLIASS